MSEEFYVVVSRTHDESIGGRGYYDSYSITPFEHKARELYESMKNSEPLFGKRLEVLLIKGSALALYKS